MEPKPMHVGRHFAEQFQEVSVVAAYAYRPPIPDKIFDELLRLMVTEPKTVLDAGAGTGAVARRLAPVVDRVDAIDFSAAMVEAGRRLPEGNHLNLHWVVGSLEHALLNPPYALIVAAGSLHWMDWEIVLPRFREALVAGGSLAIVWQQEVRQPWSEALGQLISRYSTNQAYRPLDLIQELTTRELFEQRGAYQTQPVPFTQSVASYVESLHSRNGFSRERMDAESALAFDDAVAKLLKSFYSDDVVRLEIIGHLVWGEPAPRM